MFGRVNVWQIAKPKMVSEKVGEWIDLPIRVLIIRNLNGSSLANHGQFAKVLRYTVFNFEETFNF